MMKPIFVLLLLAFGPALAIAADVMFEGYYRIDLEKKPIGYIIQRFEFDPKKKQFISTSFQRAKFNGKVVQESLKALASDKFEPVSYQYTSQVDTVVKTIDSSFKGQIMTTVTTDGKKARTENSKIPKGTFLSTFLPYVIMKKKLSVGEAFKYSAVAEEDGNSYDGKIMIEAKQVGEGYVTFRTLNSFKREQWVSSLAVVPDPDNPDHYIKGEALTADSPAKNIHTELVASAVKATEGQLVPNKILLTLFGTMPTGKLNMLATPPAKATPSPAPAAPALAPRPQVQSPPEQNGK